MTVTDCGKKLKDLRMASKVYNRLYNDMKSSLYKDATLLTLNKKVEKEIEMLNELLINDELENSYDQNTGF